MGRLTDRVVVVTGAGAGIGAAVARMAAAEGAAVAVLDVDEAAARAVADEIAATGASASAHAVDVRSAEQVSAAIEVVESHHGRIDALANIAGVVRYGDVTELSEDDWDFQIDTNLKGVYLTCRSAIPAMRRAGGGAIVNTASAQAFASQPLVAAYSASKAGVVSMTRTLALDHAADSIRVNCVCPGSVETPMLRYGAEHLASGVPAEQTMHSWGEQHPLGTLIQPDDVAQVVIFLLSDDARAVTGSPYLVDAGLTARLGV